MVTLQFTKAANFIQYVYIVHFLLILHILVENPQRPLGAVEGKGGISRPYTFQFSFKSKNILRGGSICFLGQFLKGG